MNKNFLNILSKLEDNEENKISIPELGIEVEVQDKMCTALLLSPLFKNYYYDDVFFKEKKVNKGRVLKVIELHNMMEEMKIDYICLFGHNTEKAFQFVKNKWANKFIENDVFKLIKNKHQIYIPIYKNTYTYDDLEILSTLGVTVMNLSDKLSTIFINGSKVCYSAFDSIPLINFVNSIGYFIDEYLLGELIYRISMINPDFKGILINNLNTTFVKSLSFMFIIPYSSYQDINLNLDNGSEISDLIDILNTLDFEKIKDFEYKFVRKFLYDRH